jgi:hypothetical protein
MALSMLMLHQSAGSFRPPATAAGRALSLGGLIPNPKARLKGQFDEVQQINKTAGTKRFVPAWLVVALSAK